MRAENRYTLFLIPLQDGIRLESFTASMKQ